MARRSLAICDIDQVGLNNTVEMCLEASRSDTLVTAYNVDMGNKDAVYKFADSVHRDHGRATLLFNNAGVTARSIIIIRECEGNNRSSLCILHD